MKRSTERETVNRFQAIDDAIAAANILPSNYVTAFDSMEETELYRRMSAPTLADATSEEKTGDRSDLTLSKLVRPVGCGDIALAMGTLRSMDVDQVVYCKVCLIPVIFIEGKGPNGDNYVTNVCAMAWYAPRTAWAMRVRHPSKPYDHATPEEVKTSDIYPGTKFDVLVVENGISECFRGSDVPLEGLRVEMERLYMWHKRHECPGQKPKNLVWN